MPGIQLYQTEADDCALIESVLENGCWLVPDILFTAPNASSLRTLSGFQDALVATRHFYILNEDFSSGPVALREISKAGRTVYYVSANVGTASLEFLAGGIFREPTTEARLIRPGFLEYSSAYWTEDRSRKLSSPLPALALYERLSRGVKRRNSKIKPGKTSFWLGSDALNQLRNGARLVGYEAWLPTR